MRLNRVAGATADEKVSQSRSVCNNATVGKFSCFADKFRGFRPHVLLEKSWPTLEKSGTTFSATHIELSQCLTESVEKNSFAQKRMIVSVASAPVFLV